MCPRSGYIGVIRSVLAGMRIYGGLFLSFRLLHVYIVLRPYIVLAIHYYFYLVYLYLLSAASASSCFRTDRTNLDIFFLYIVYI